MSDILIKSVDDAQGDRYLIFFKSGNIHEPLLCLPEWQLSVMLVAAGYVHLTRKEHGR